MNRNPVLWTDGYKICHKEQYPKGTEWVYETWTPRKSRIEGINHVVFFGLQGALSEIKEMFDEHFFSKDRNRIIDDYIDTVTHVFGRTNSYFSSTHSWKHIGQLHDLGYLPIKVKALPEGSFVPIGCPMFTIENTLPEFFWLPGYLESMLSSMIWMPMTSATIADNYRRILMRYAEKSGDTDFVSRQAGDFSMRGMGSPEAAYRCSSGHLTSFSVSATISARKYLMNCYRAKENCLLYTPSTEHSVMCAYGRDEIEAFRHLITSVYPSGNVSIVSDSYDLWNIVDSVLPALKDEIMARDGKVIIRPDSGEPVDIVCGYDGTLRTTETKGIVERLYEIFGGTENEKGYRQLDPHIGVIYGDSITVKRAEEICQKLVEKGFASTNVILGVGSYSYQYVTRDTFGFALKATAVKINGEFKMIFKDPATDTDKFKKSQKGICMVVWDEEADDYMLIDNQDLSCLEKEFYRERNLLKPHFIDGNFLTVNTFDEIRERVKKESKRIYKY